MTVKAADAPSLDSDGAVRLCPEGAKSVPELKRIFQSFRVSQNF